MFFTVILSCFVWNTDRIEMLDNTNSPKLPSCFLHCWLLDQQINHITIYYFDLLKHASTADSLVSQMVDIKQTSLLIVSYDASVSTAHGSWTLSNTVKSFSDGWLLVHWWEWWLIMVKHPYHQLIITITRETSFTRHSPSITINHYHSPSQTVNQLIHHHSPSLIIINNH